MAQAKYRLPASLDLEKYVRRAFIINNNHRLHEIKINLMLTAKTENLNLKCKKLKKFAIVKSISYHTFSFNFGVRFTLQLLAY